MNRNFRPLCWPLTLVFSLLWLAGCQTDQKTAVTPAQPPAITAPVAAATPVPEAAATAVPAADASPIELKPPVRIKAGTTTAVTDSSGQAWLPDQGFEGGDVVDRAEDLKIANTADPGLYRSEHYVMTAFTCKLPNGRYVVKLHFAETFESIEGPGQRVFSFNVQGHDYKDFDVFVKAGGAFRAYVETVNVEVTDGTFKITFASGVENPEINGIEILPAA
jgi:hypothetical protein